MKDTPLRGAGFGAAVSRYFQRYAVFTGRASRSEYWWVQLFQWLLGIVPAVLFGTGFALSATWAAENPVRTPVGYDAAGNEVVYEASPGIIHAPMAWMILVALGLWALIGLALVVPTWALIWRRMHDGNRPGPLSLLALIPFVGGIILLVFMLLPSDPAGARFDRLEGAA